MMIYTGKNYFTFNVMAIFRLHLLSMFLLPTFFIAQIVQDKNALVYVSEDAIVFEQNNSKTITENTKVYIFITDDAIIYNKEKIANTEIIASVKSLGENLLSKRKGAVKQTLSKKIAKKQYHLQQKTETKAIINSIPEDKNLASFFFTSKDAVTAPANSIVKYIIVTPVAQTAFHNFRNIIPKIYYQDLEFFNTYLSDICARPPPINI